MDDSKLRLRRSSQHATAIANGVTTTTTTTTTTTASMPMSICEGGGILCSTENNSNGGAGGGPSSSLSVLHGSSSHSNLNVNLTHPASPKAATTAYANTLLASFMPQQSASSCITYTQIKGRRKRRRRRKIFSKICRLGLGGVAAVIVSASLSYTFLPLAWFIQVDYHHQLQNEVLFLYQNLEDNRKNYHSVVDNYHPNGSSSSSNSNNGMTYHRHTTGMYDNTNNKQNHHQYYYHNRNIDDYEDEEEEALDMGPVDNIGLVQNKNNFVGPINNIVGDVNNIFMVVGPEIDDKHKKKRKNLRHYHSSSDNNNNNKKKSSSSAEFNNVNNDNNNAKNNENMILKRPEIVTCGDGVTVGFLNDDYCDCPQDGYDEPDTSACSNVLVQQTGKFECGRKQRRQQQQNNHINTDSIETETKPIWIYASRVNDGIVDCPDGSDEYGYVIDEQQQYQKQQQQQQHNVNTAIHVSI